VKIVIVIVPSSPSDIDRNSSKLTKKVIHNYEY